ncbi:hypothetical protein LJ737_16885 [Hymenobacter sp. 15J16-1T3B]|uniref:hypothetical protein n=1 Tax=Hymenobacter sp. 15J16-1T3B TaxID=2886941 RepID=UPI001D10AA1D|nr:hypothetical protein [Hymenobacter sp. 15J16-1T3B]MCC3158921.1 hypothetical protein [Hymenobacter sp. 15J16-1T3B]
MRQLLFVYNASAGPGHALLDSLHKVVSPGTYPCTLCGLTYGLTSMRPEWKAFLQTLPLPARFLYRDQLPEAYPALVGQPLSAIFLEDEAGRVAPLVTAAEMQPLNLPGLIELLQQRLQLEA